MAGQTRRRLLPCSASKSSFQLHCSALASLLASDPLGQGLDQAEQLERPKVRLNPKKAVGDK